GNVGPIDKGAAQAATRQGVFAWLRPPSVALFTCVRGEPSAGLETCDTAGLEACATGAGSKCTREPVTNIPKMPEPWKMGMSHADGRAAVGRPPLRAVYHC